MSNATLESNRRETRLVEPSQPQTKTTKAAIGSQTSNKTGKITSTEIADFANQKLKSIEMSMDNDPQWQEQIRREIEMEIERQVREALDTPPLERRRRNREKQMERKAATFVAESFHSPISTGFRSLRSAKYSNSNDHNNDNPDDLVGKSKARTNSIDEIACQRFHRELYKILFGTSSVDNDPQPKTGESPRSYEIRTENSILKQPGSQNPRKTVTFADADESGEVPFGGRVVLETRVRRGKEAVQCFGDLTPAEKELFFSNFTKEAFVLARQRMVTSKRMQLPDGSTMQAHASGQFKDQYGVIRDDHGPFWPKDFGPICGAPTLKRVASPKVEPLLLNPNQNPNGGEKQPGEKPVNLWKVGYVVYDSVKSNPDQPVSVPSSNVTPSLIFESRFESGNLRQARRIGDLTYELVLNNDLYTKRHTQWYYFRVRNALPHVAYTFIIVNLLKKSSLYSDGMQPLFYSEKSAKNDGSGWTRIGRNIRYVPNLAHLTCPLLDKNREYYQLEWVNEFPFADDVCYFAHCYPYAFSDLKADIDNILSDPKRKTYMHREVLCETLLGNSCFVLTISNFNTAARPDAASEQNANSQPHQTKRKRAIVITARVHPGESNSSWVMKGLMEFLTSESPTARSLRDKFLFKLIPMLNPDGVIVGNYRCALIGRDLNRNYRKPGKERIPTIWHTKEMIRNIAESYEIFMYCDLHGHSRQSQAFVYGCDISNVRPDDAFYERRKAQADSADSFFSNRAFSWLLHEAAPGKFDFAKCNYNIAKYKETTGRVVMWRQFGIDYSFTFEVTFSGTDGRKLGGEDHHHSASASTTSMGVVQTASTSTSTSTSGVPRHFNIRDLEELGEAFGNAILKLDEIRSDAAERTKKFQAMLDFMLRPSDNNNSDNSNNSNESQANRSGVADRSSKTRASETKPASIVLPDANHSRKRESDNVNDSSRVAPRLEDVFKEFAVLKPRLIAFGNGDESDDSSDSNSGGDSDVDLPKHITDKLAQAKKKRKIKRRKSHPASNSRNSEKELEKTNSSLRSELSHINLTLPFGSKTRQNTSFINEHDLDCACCKATASKSDDEQDSQSEIALERADEEDGETCTCRLKRESSLSLSLSLGLAPKFVNRYESRNNCGIPCFSLERTLERAQRRLENAESRFANDPVKKQAFKSECERQINQLKARLRLLLVSNRKAQTENNDFDAALFNNNDNDNNNNSAEAVAESGSVALVPASVVLTDVRPVQLKYNNELSVAFMGETAGDGKLPLDSLANRKTQMSVSKRKVQTTHEDRHDDGPDHLAQSLANGIVAKKNAPILEKIRRNGPADPRHYLLAAASRESSLGRGHTWPSTMNNEREHTDSMTSFSDSDQLTTRSADLWPQAGNLRTRASSFIDALPTAAANLLHDRNADLSKPQSLRVVVQKPRTLPRLKHQKSKTAAFGSKPAAYLKH